VHSFLLRPLTIHVLAVFVTIVLVADTLAAIHGLNLFAFHPLFMTVGCVLFMTEGLLVYRNGSLVGVFEPIMAGSPKQKTRTIHLFLQATGSAFVLAGLSFILANKARYGKSTVPATPHALVGTSAVFLVLVQGLVGSHKAGSAVPVHRWHGSSGKLCFDLCLAAVGSGAAGFLPAGPGKLAGLAGLAGLWLAAQLQHEVAARKADSEGPTVTGGGGGGGFDAASPGMVHSRSPSSSSHGLEPGDSDALLGDEGI
jgi:hypothetical protein